MAREIKKFRMFVCLIHDVEHLRTLNSRDNFFSGELHVIYMGFTKAT